MESSEYKKLSKEEQKKVPFKEWPKARRFGFLFFIFTILLFVVIVIIGIATDNNTHIPTESEAYHISKSFIKPMLKAPATADFPFADWKFRKIDENSFYIESYVDAQNSFGAKIRTNYWIKLRYKSGEWMDYSNWEVLDVNLQE